MYKAKIATNMLQSGEFGDTIRRRQINEAALEILELSFSDEVTVALLKKAFGNKIYKLPGLFADSRVLNYELLQQEVRAHARTRKLCNLWALKFHDSALSTESRYMALWALANFYEEQFQLHHYLKDLDHALFCFQKLYDFAITQQNGEKSYFNKNPGKAFHVDEALARVFKALIAYGEKSKDDLQTWLRLHPEMKGMQLSPCAQLFKGFNKLSEDNRQSLLLNILAGNEEGTEAFDLESYRTLIWSQVLNVEMPNLNVAAARKVIAYTWGLLIHEPTRLDLLKPLAEAYRAIEPAKAIALHRIVEHDTQTNSEDHLNAGWQILSIQSSAQRIKDPKTKLRIIKLLISNKARNIVTLVNADNELLTECQTLLTTFEPVRSPQFQAEVAGPSSAQSAVPEAANASTPLLRGVQVQDVELGQVPLPLILLKQESFHPLAEGVRNVTELYLKKLEALLKSDLPDKFILAKIFCDAILYSAEAREQDRVHVSAILGAMYAMGEYGIELNTVTALTHFQAAFLLAMRQEFVAPIQLSQGNLALNLLSVLYVIYQGEDLGLDLVPHLFNLLKAVGICQGDLGFSANSYNFPLPVEKSLEPTKKLQMAVTLMQNYVQSRFEIDAAMTGAAGGDLRAVFGTFSALVRNVTAMQSSSINNSRGAGATLNLAVFNQNREQYERECKEVFKRIHALADQRRYYPSSTHGLITPPLEEYLRDFSNIFADSDLNDQLLNSTTVLDEPKVLQIFEEAYEKLFMGIHGQRAWLRVLEAGSELENSSKLLRQQGLIWKELNKNLKKSLRYYLTAIQAVPEAEADSLIMKKTLVLLCKAMLEHAVSVFILKARAHLFEFVEFLKAPQAEAALLSNEQVPAAAREQRIREVLNTIEAMLTRRDASANPKPSQSNVKFLDEHLLNGRQSLSVGAIYQFNEKHMLDTAFAGTAERVSEARTQEIYASGNYNLPGRKVKAGVAVLGVVAVTLATGVVMHVYGPDISTLESIGTTTIDDYLAGVMILPAEKFAEEVLHQFGPTPLVTVVNDTLQNVVHFQSISMETVGALESLHSSLSQAWAALSNLGWSLQIGGLTAAAGLSALAGTWFVGGKSQFFEAIPERIQPEAEHVVVTFQGKKYRAEITEAKVSPEQQIFNTFIKLAATAQCDEEYKVDPKAIHEHQQARVGTASGNTALAHRFEPAIARVKHAFPRGSTGELSPAQLAAARGLLQLAPTVTEGAAFNPGDLLALARDLAGAMAGMRLTLLEVASSKELVPFQDLLAVATAMAPAFQSLMPTQAPPSNRSESNSSSSDLMAAVSNGQ